MNISINRADILAIIAVADKAVRDAIENADDILRAKIGEDGHLWITLRNGRRIDAGSSRGKDGMGSAGPPGKDGKDGEPGQKVTLAKLARVEKRETLAIKASKGNAVSRVRRVIKAIKGRRATLAPQEIEVRKATRGNRALTA